MDIEHLSKSQIVLLTLLVSFVTSIATGIVTVSLMDQAPPAIAQTVNRVIERTVEKVSASGQTAAVVTQQKTVVVKESDLIAQAIDRVNPSIVRLYTTAKESPTFLGLGVVLDAEGMIISDTDAIGSGDAIIELSDGTLVRASVNARNAATGVAYLRSATTTSEGKEVHWSPAAISTSQPVLGETVVALSGRTISRIADGIITAIIPSARVGEPQIIDTSVESDSIMFGSPLIDIDGSLLGVSTSAARASSASGFVIADALMPDSDAKNLDEAQ